MQQEIRKEINRALVLCLPYLCIVFFRDDLDKWFSHMHSHTGNPMLVLYMTIATVLIGIFFMQNIVDAPGSYRSYGWIAMLPLIIYSLALAGSFWSPLNITSQIFRSRIVYRAYRQDRYGHALMKMRKDSSMDIRYPGPFGLSDWEYGRWSRGADTFYFRFDNGKAAIAADDMLSDTMVMSGAILHPLHMPPDSIKAYRSYLFKMSGAR
jgi:uncharacterized integral membrane protein